MVDPEPAAGALADAILVREALRARALGSNPDPLAGLRVDEAEVARLVEQLSGGDARGGGRRPASVDKAVEEATKAFASTLAGDGLLASIVRRARLEGPEAQVLALLVSVELDPRRQRLLGYVQDDVTKTRPTLATLRRVFDEAGVRAVAPEGRLRRAALVTVDEAAAWGTQVVTLATGVTWALVGDASLEPDLPRDATVYVPNLDPSGEPLVLVSGEDRVRRLQAAMTATAGNAFLVTSAPTSEAGWQAVVRQATVAGMAVVLEVEDTLTTDARWWVDHADHLPWAVSSRGEIPLEDVPRRTWVDARASSPEATDEEVRQALGDTDRQGHRLSAEQLRLVADAMAGTGGDIHAAVRRLASGPLDRLARRIRPSRTWDDIILSPDRIAQLRELTSRYRHRDTVYSDWGFPSFPSSGLVALFSGSSGTGKTLAAEIVAGELGLDLYKLELSSVVSKYIGETEKNLERVFNAASAGNLVLFFDEADSLFGKRSEVSDARDRYANIEVSYLLQRLEAYDGLVVMATNFQKNIDDAFLRRIHVGIDFPLPEEPEREAIWRHAFPPGAPTKDLDWEFLAKQFKLAGGNIKGAALHAAFLAAELGTPITMEMVMLSLKREFQKLGRLRTATEFGKYTEFVNSTP